MAHDDDKRHVTRPVSRDTLDDVSAAIDRKAVEVDYTNWRGERGWRRIIPLSMRWSEGDQWHPEPQWIIDAIDCRSHEIRGFAWVNIHETRPWK